MTRLRLIALSGLLLAALSGPGCIIIPLPEHGSLAGRNAISRESVEALLVPGTTTVTDVLLALGEPERVERDRRVLIYAWTVTQGIIAVAAGYSGDAAPIPKNYLLLLRFDEHGVLERYEHTEARWFQSRGGRAVEWMEEDLEMNAEAPP